jgi:cell wall-associated NlpC family hydrolase
LKRQITASVAANKARYSGLKAKVKRLLRDRQLAEVAASKREAERVRQLQAAASTQAVAVNDIGGVSSTSTSSGSSSGTDDPGVSVTVPAASTAGEAAANIALGELGTPYVWGGAAPGGFDCSGLVSWAYAQAGHGGLPHYTGALWNAGTRISEGDLAPGDLVFFHGLGHVGIYIGGGNFVHAPHTGDVVKISSLAGYSGYDGAVRISG